MVFVSISLLQWCNIDAFVGMLMLGFFFAVVDFVHILFMCKVNAGKIFNSDFGALNIADDMTLNE